MNLEDKATYQVGDRVLCTDRVGNWLPGTVVALEASKYAPDGIQYRIFSDYNNPDNAYGGKGWGRYLDGIRPLNEKSFTGDIEFEI